MLLCPALVFLMFPMQLRQQDRVVQDWEWRHLDSSPSSPLDLSWNFGHPQPFSLFQFLIPSEELLLIDQVLMVSDEGMDIMGFGFFLDKWFLKKYVCMHVCVYLPI